ncbi:MAG: polyprenyl diphosphate synthase, partial [Candidatus Binatia bacterium]
DIRALTLYAFSSQNWDRPADEVAALMHLLRDYLIEERPEIMDNGIRLIAIGNTRKLPREVLTELRRVERATRRNDGMTVVLAVSYGGRQDIVSAARALAREARDGRLRPEQITEQIFGRSLMTKGIPDPDLLIRTSGEMRISNFLLWQLAYTEIYVTDTPWPEFRRREFIRALRYFQGRIRRFGRTTEQLAVER